MKLTLKASLLALIISIFTTSCGSDSNEEPTPQDITGIESIVQLSINDEQAFTLSGPTQAISVSTSNSQIVTASVGSDGKTLTLTALAEGTATLTLTAQDANTRTIQVKVVPYSVSVNGTTALSILSIVKNKESVWLLEASGFPYNKKGLQISNLPASPKQGESITVTLSTLNNISNISSGEKTGTVDFVTDSSIGLSLAGNITIVMPR